MTQKTKQWTHKENKKKAFNVTLPVSLIEKIDFVCQRVTREKKYVFCERALEKEIAEAESKL